MRIDDKQGVDLSVARNRIFCQSILNYLRENSSCPRCVAIELMNYSNNWRILDLLVNLKLITRFKHCGYYITDMGREKDIYDVMDWYTLEPDHVAHHNQ